MKQREQTSALWSLLALIGGLVAASGCLAEASSKLAIKDAKLPAPEFGHGGRWKATEVFVTRADGTRVWDVRAPLRGSVEGVSVVRYGSLPEGFIEYVSAQPLVAGECYRIYTDAAPAGGSSIDFRVASASTIALGCPARP